MNRAVTRASISCLLSSAILLSGVVFADVTGVAAGIPEPQQREAIVQLFNWTFNDIKDKIPTLKALGYSHIHVSPPQKSNEKVWQWWGRYQPVDFSVISGPLGSETEFEQMSKYAEAHAIQIVVDTVLNHTVDVDEQPDPPFVRLDGNKVSEVRLPQFRPEHFHQKCQTAAGTGADQECWLECKLADLNTRDTHVRQVAKDYLKKLADLGVNGYRFDAAIHIEPEFYTDVLSVVPGKLVFGEIIKSSTSHFEPWIAIEKMRFYDFPLANMMKEAFAPGGDLTKLKEPKANGRALDGSKAITFVRNHDIDRGQVNDRGLKDGGHREYSVGWDDDWQKPNWTDIHLAYAYIFGREDGLPYVFVDMNTLCPEAQDDRYDDPFIVAGIRFHNLSLADTNNDEPRKEKWQIEKPNTIGWQRGEDRFVVINKAKDRYEIKDLKTTLRKGEYKDVRTGLPLHVQSDGWIKHWDVPPRSAMMFVRVGD